MKIIVNGVEEEASDELEAQINAFQTSSLLDKSIWMQEIQMYIDSKAQEKDYKDGLSCISYVGSSVLLWHEEASAFKEWRDLVYAYAYHYLGEVENGAIPTPTFEDFFGQMPQLQWPQL